MQERIRVVFGMKLSGQSSNHIATPQHIDTPQRKRRQSKTAAIEVIKRQRVIPEEIVVEDSEHKESTENHDDATSSIGIVEDVELEESEPNGSTGNHDVAAFSLGIIENRQHYQLNADFDFFANLDSMQREFTNEDLEWMDAYASYTDTSSIQTPLHRGAELETDFSEAESKVAEYQLKYQDKERSANTLTNQSHDVVDAYFTDLLNDDNALIDFNDS
jgi:hypothetical protein